MKFRFYSGHRHFHLLNTQLICDNTGHVRFLQTGFLGGMHDSQTFRLMEPVSPGQVLDLPNGVVLLADKGTTEKDVVKESSTKSLRESASELNIFSKK